MYCGKIIEKAPVQELFVEPLHPYTRGLLSAIPSLGVGENQVRKRLETIKGMVPSLLELPLGCNFQDRCCNVQPDCRGEQGPPPLEKKQPGHLAACFHPHQGKLHH